MPNGFIWSDVTSSASPIRPELAATTVELQKLGKIASWSHRPPQCSVLSAAPHPETLTSLDDLTLARNSATYSVAVVVYAPP